LTYRNCCAIPAGIPYKNALPSEKRPTPLVVTLCVTNAAPVKWLPPLDLPELLSNSGKKNKETLGNGQVAAAP